MAEQNMRVWTKAVTALAMVAAALPAAADEMLEMLRRDSLSSPMMAFERTATIRQGKAVEQVRVDRFDPRARPTEQWTLVSVNGAPPSEEDVRRHQKQVNAQPVPGFHRLNSLLAGDPTAIERKGNRTIYRWDQLQKGAAPTGQGPDFSDRLSAEATVRTDGPRPVLEQVRIYAAEPFAIMGVARMRRFEAVTRYAHGARGHQLVSQLTDVDARAPFGMGGARVTEATFRPL
jgi:hypothetical protein